MRSISLLLIAMALAWAVVMAYRTGRVRQHVTRKAQPAMYWLSLIVTALMALGFVAAATALWLRG